MYIVTFNRTFKIKKMEEKKDYYNGIIHDALSTLNGVSGLLELVAENLEGKKGNQENLGYIKMAHDGAKSLTHRFQQIMVMNRLEAGEIKKSEFDLYSLTDKIILTFVVEFRKENINFVIINNLAGSSCFGNQDLISRALHNLLRNAVEESLKNHHKTKTIVVRLESNQKDTEIEVANQGNMTDEVMANLFEKKFTTKINGHGLGTKIIQAVAIAHGGSAFVSKENETIKIGIKIPNY